MTNMLIRNGIVSTMDDKNTIHDPGWVWVEDDRIKGVGTVEPPSHWECSYDRIIDATDMLVLPGLVNSHTHLCQSFMRGIAWDCGLRSWLDHLRPIRLEMTPEDVRLSVMIGLVENLRSGITSVIHHHKVTNTPEHIHSAIEAACSFGLRTLIVIGFGDMGRNGGGSWKKIETMLPGLIEHCHLHHDRVSIGLGPTCIQRCSEEALRESATVARDFGIPWHIHVSEAPDEVAITVARTGRRPIEMLDAIHALGDNTQLVHCIHASTREISIIAEHKSSIVHCPISNMYLASGIAPVRSFLDSGVRVALGTDGAASNNSQNMLETMKVASLLGKIGTGNPNAIGPKDVLHMATVAGAHLMGRGNVGRIEIGAKADIVVVNYNVAGCTPHFNPQNTVVYSACNSEIHTVIVDGDVLLDDYRLVKINELDLLEESLEAARLLHMKAGLSKHVIHLSNQRP